MLSVIDQDLSRGQTLRDDILFQLQDISVIMEHSSNLQDNNAKPIKSNRIQNNLKANRHTYQKHSYSTQ